METVNLAFTTGASFVQNIVMAAVAIAASVVVMAAGYTACCILDWGARKVVRWSLKRARAKVSEREAARLSGLAGTMTVLAFTGLLLVLLVGLGISRVASSFE